MMDELTRAGVRAKTITAVGTGLLVPPPPGGAGAGIPAGAGFPAVLVTDISAAASPERVVTMIDLFTLIAQRKRVGFCYLKRM